MIIQEHIQNVINYFDSLTEDKDEYYFDFTHLVYNIIEAYEYPNSYSPRQGGFMTTIHRAHQDVINNFLNTLKDNNFIEEFTIRKESQEELREEMQIEVGDNYYIVEFMAGEKILDIYILMDLALAEKDKKELYGEMLQRKKILQYIYEKSNAFESADILLHPVIQKDKIAEVNIGFVKDSLSYFQKEDLEYIRIAKTIRLIEDDGLIKIKSIKYDLNHSYHFFVISPAEISIQILDKAMIEKEIGGERRKTNIMKLEFDIKENKIKSTDQELTIPIGTIEYFLCKLLFEKPFGEKIQENEIIRSVDMEKYQEEAPRSVYDATRRLNKKIEEKFNIKELIRYKESNVWIRKEVFD